MGNKRSHSPLSKHQCWLRLSFIEDRRRTANDNGSSTVPTQRVLKNPSHLAVPVWHMGFLFRKKKRYWLLQPNQRKKHRGKQVSDGDTGLRKTRGTIICGLVFRSCQSLECPFWDPALRKLASPFTHFNELDLQASSVSTARMPSVLLQMNTN